MEKLDRLGWVVQDNYKIGESVVAIRCTSEPFADLLRSVLSEYETDEEDEPYLSLLFDGDAPAEGPMKTFNIIYRGTERMIKTRSARRFFDAVMRELFRFEVGRYEDLIFVEAATVLVDGVAALLPYWGGNARDPAAVHFDRRGLGFVDGSVATLSTRTGMLVPTPEFMQVPDDVYARLAAIAPEPDRPERGVVAVQDERPVVAAAVWGTYKQEPVEPMTNAMMVHALASRTFNRWGVRGKLLSTLAGVVGSVPCYAIKPGLTSPGAAEAIVRDAIERAG